MPLVYLGAKTDSEDGVQVARPRDAQNKPPTSCNICILKNNHLLGIVWDARR